MGQARNEENDNNVRVSHGHKAEKHNDARAPRKATTAEALMLIFAWYCLSTALSVYNKKIFGKKYGVLSNEPFPAPLFMTAWQFMGQYALAVLAHALGFPRSTDPDSKRSWRTYATTVLPNGVATGLDIGFSNVSFAFITLSFYTMCKASAPLFLMVCAFMWGIETPTWRLAGIVGTIATGLFLLVGGEAEKDEQPGSSSFSFIGFALVMSAAAMSGVRWTITQILLQGQSNKGGHHVTKGTALEVMEAMTPVMAATVAVMSIIAEPLLDMWNKSTYFESAHNISITFSLMTVGTVVAFTMVLVEFVLIAKTSALTFMVAGVMKELLTIVVAKVTYGDTFSELSAFGMAVLLVGVAMFNYMQYQKKLEAEGNNNVPADDEVPLQGDAKDNHFLLSESELMPSNTHDGIELPRNGRRGAESEV